jgi:hypothetical protein
VTICSGIRVACEVKIVAADTAATTEEPTIVAADTAAATGVRRIST